MVRDGRDDPFDDIFDELERLMDEMVNGTVDRDEPSNMTEPAPDMDLHVRTHQTEETVSVIGDLPNIPQEQLDLRCDGETLTIEITDRGTTRVTLPARVDEHSAAATFNNGVLEVTFDRIDESASISLD